MYTGKIIFSQVMNFLPMDKFRECVERYHGNYKIQSFSCLDQFICMTFAQLTYRESLRDIEACLRAVPNKLYHMGIRGQVSRSTLAYTNENRDWRIYDSVDLLPVHEISILNIAIKSIFGTIYGISWSRKESKSTESYMPTLLKY